MGQKAPGKSHRKGLTFLQLIKMFPDDATAEKWFESRLWPDGPFCPTCKSFNVQSATKHPRMTHRCRDCKKAQFFTLRKGTVMQGSHLGYQVWAVAIYQMTTNLKGVSSMKLHRDLGITQKSAWHLAHRLRKAFEYDGTSFEGPVEIDETYMGGKERNKHAKKKLNAGRGTVGKTAVVGAKDRKTNQVRAQVAASTDAATLQGFVHDTTEPGAAVYTDEATVYDSLSGFEHKAVKHSVGEYVKGKAHTNGVESFWAMLKRAHKGTFHQMSNHHLNRYVREFAGRHNIRELDTLEQMGFVASCLFGCRLRYKDLVA